MVSLENVEAVKAKKAKRRAVEEGVENIDTSIKKKKKKKKKNAEPEEETIAEIPSAVEVDEDPPEDLPFRKNFYSVNELTESMTKEEVKAFWSEHNIVLYGKGRKKFKPILTFKELGFPEEVMKICSGFEKPTPIQVGWLISTWRQYSNRTLTICVLWSYRSEVFSQGPPCGLYAVRFIVIPKCTRGNGRKL